MNLKNKNVIYLEKRLKVLLPEYGMISESSKVLALTINKNIESLGYTFSGKALLHLSSLTETQLANVYREIVPVLKKMRGAHKIFTPMYPNFPKQVMEMSEVELYINAIVHYLSFQLMDEGVISDTWLPQYEKLERLPLTEQHALDVINIGDINDFNSIFTSLLSGKTSISESDKSIVKWFIETYKNEIFHILPDSIPLKENVGLSLGCLLKYVLKDIDESLLVSCFSNYIKTPTDVLRVLASYSGGDVSLATNTKFVNLKRAERRVFLSLLERFSGNLTENMVKYRNRWIRVGEILHPSEYKNRFPNVANAFKQLREERRIVTFNTRVEEYLLNGNSLDAVDLLLNKPGEFARRLDHLLRISNKTSMRNEIVKKFISVADKVSTPVLLQVYNHFNNRNLNKLRTFFPKGNIAKAKVLENILPNMELNVCVNVINYISRILVERFKALPSLGKVYIDKSLKGYLVPFSQRSASKALKTIVRGSKLDLDGDYNIIRFFIWWKNRDGGRTDIDLSGYILSDRFSEVSTISFYNLSDFGGVHSGDITNAPNGASEFIDIDLSNVIQRGGRYIVMSLNMYTNDKFVDLPECFAGWMGREEADSGEIFEPKTVKNKFDLTSDSRIALPFIIDAVERKVIWMDMSLKSMPGFYNTVSANKNNIGLTCKAMCELKKFNLYDLFSLHAEARGTLVSKAADADTIFSETDGITPYDTDKIISEFL